MEKHMTLTEYRVLTEQEREVFFKELRQAVKDIEPYYDVDRIKSYTVYIWTKDTDDDFGENVFDIMNDEIVYYTKDHVIPEEVMPIIKNIQTKLISLIELI